ncbi:MAG: GIY-YIG nuclease family protein [Polyangiaceae bacterium]|nr:GIY-YIG nuclease family protein [Polyangiaceae bacterium]
MRLADLDVLVIDCQTTGATPALGDLLEVGWTIARARGEQEDVVARRVALPEGKRIPRIISKLTGLDRAAAGEGDQPSSIWSGLREAAARASSLRGAVPTVIHFARFELVFLRDLHARFGDGDAFPFDVVCAHDIARRLLPDLPRRGLRALAGYFGHGVELERRSASHTEATAYVWRKLVDELRARDVSDWSELRAWLETKAPPPSRRRAFPLPRERRLALPDAPGVYRMLRSNGDILYVGKATSLKQRVSNHFTQGKTTERALEMLTQVHDIRVTPTATVLEAALLETDEIKLHDPPYNVQLRRDRSAWFVSPDLDEAREIPATARWIGPLPSRWAMTSFAAVRALALGAEPTPALFGRAVGVPPSFAPDADTFVAGWASFVERHVAPMRSRTWWGRFVKASKVLLRLLGEGSLEEGEGTPDWSWDPDRVRRHLERSVLQGGQLARRARWLAVLADASVVFREADSRPRKLRFEGGDILVAEDHLADSGDPACGPTRNRLARMASFDGARYDRLRVLTTELKRVLSEGGDVAIVVDCRRALRTDRLVRALTTI